MLDTPTLIRVALEALGGGSQEKLPAPGPDELKRMYALMHMGRVLDDKAPNYLKQAIGCPITHPVPATMGFNWPWDSLFAQARITCSPTTAI